MNDKTKSVLKYVLSAILAVVLLYLSFRGIDWKEFFSVLKECRWVMVLASMFSGMLAAAFRSLRWRLLIKPEDPEARFIDCFNGFNVGKLSDMAVPHVGEFIRCGFVTSKRISYDKVLGTVIVERAWDIIVLFFLLFLLLIFKWNEFGSFFMERIITPLTGGLGDGIEGKALAAGFLIALILIAMVVWKFLRKRMKSPLGRLGSFLRGIADGALTFMKMERKYVFLLYTVLLWLMFIAMSMLIIDALPQVSGLGISDALFILIIGTFAGILPVPGGFGAFHYLIAIAIQSLYGIPFEMGLIFATISHESQALMTVFLGSASYICSFFVRRKETE